MTNLNYCNPACDPGLGGHPDSGCFKLCGKHENLTVKFATKSAAVEKMKPIAELIKQYGTQKKLADAMGVNQGQVSSWLRYGALVTDDGAVWVKRRDGVDGLGLFEEGRE